MAFSDQSDDQSNQQQKQGTEQDQQQSDQQKQGTQQQNQQTTGQSVFMVVGERAYRTQDDVVNKLNHADQHIATLESERDADRQTIKNQETEIGTLKAEVERLTKIVDALPGGKDTNAVTSGKEQQTAIPSKEELVKDVLDEMQAKTTAEQRKANHTACIEAAKKKFGDGNVDAEVERIAGDLGMSVDQVVQLAAHSPKGFNKLFLGGTGDIPAGPSQSSRDVNTNSFQDTQQSTEKPVNITKLPERARISHVKQRMTAAGIKYAQKPQR